MMALGIAGTGGSARLQAASADGGRVRACVMGSLTPRCLGGGSAVPAELAAWALKRVHFVRCERSLPAARPVPSRPPPTNCGIYSLRCFTFSCMLLADAR
eukprot:COSAG02_NODE_13429_length_1396_cov_1.753277_3_plen_100_part_00